MSEFLYEKICQAQAQRISDLEEALESSKRMIGIYEKQVKVQQDLIEEQQKYIDNVHELIEQTQKTQD